jgi:hypothetical protein
LSRTGVVDVRPTEHGLRVVFGAEFVADEDTEQRAPEGLGQDYDFVKSDSRQSDS